MSVLGISLIIGGLVLVAAGAVAAYHRQPVQQSEGREKNSNFELTKGDVSAVDEGQRAATSR